jgi:hypothetical protein
MCGCASNKQTVSDIVEHVKSKGKENQPPLVKHEIECECGEVFSFTKVIMNCPKCDMTYAVTPCSSADKNNIKMAMIELA